MPADSPVKLPFRRRFPKIARRTFFMLLRIYLLVGLVLYALQTKLIFPGASTQGTPEALVDPPPNSQLLHLVTGDKTTIVALFGHALVNRGPDAPTVIFFYGNGMCLADAIGEFELFRRLGTNCIAVEYEGYGMSGGKPSEQGCYAAAEAAYQHLLTRTDIARDKIIPAGWSLGGAVAIDLAHKHQSIPAGQPGHIVALVTFSAFTSMPEVAQHHFPIFPAGLVVQHKFYSEEKLRDLRPDIPAFIAHGQLDDIVPYAHFARLISTAHTRGLPLTQLTLPTAHHNDFFNNADEDIVPTLKKFLARF